MVRCVAAWLVSCQDFETSCKVKWHLKSLSIASKLGNPARTTWVVLQFVALPALFQSQSRVPTFPHSRWFIGAGTSAVGLQAASFIRITAADIPLQRRSGSLASTPTFLPMKQAHCEGTAPAGTRDKIQAASNANRLSVSETETVRTQATTAFLTCFYLFARESTRAYTFAYSFYLHHHCLLS